MLEIDKKGKVLNTWKLVTEKPLKVEGDTVYQEVLLLEDPKNYESKTQAFIFKINTSGNFEVLPYSSDDTWQTQMIACPKEIDESLSCVEDKITKRRFVIEDKCGKRL
jgi:hypothetical protein